MPKKLISKDLEERILQVAENLFLKYGYTKTGMRDISRNSKVSVGLIYKIFKSKEDIFVRIIRKHLKEALDELNLKISKVSSFEERLSNFIESFLNQFKKKEKLFYLFLTSLGSHFLLDKERFQLQDISQRFSQMLANIIEMGKLEGKVDKNINSYLLSEFLLGGIINSIYFLVIEKKGEISSDFQEAIKAILNQFFPKDKIEESAAKDKGKRAKEVL